MAYSHTLALKLIILVASFTSCRIFSHAIINHSTLYTGCNRRNGPDFGRVFLMLNYTEKPPKHLYSKFNGYGDIGQRKVWISLVSAYCTLSVT